MCRRVLIVDDYKDVQMVLQGLLEDEAYEVDIADDGLVALKKLTGQSTCYGAVLLDIEMPGMNGLQLIQKLLQQQDPIVEQIIVQSANAEARAEALRLGIRYVIPKPLDLNMVLDYVIACESSFTAPVCCIEENVS